MNKESENDFINFEDIRSTLEISDNAIFETYLKELFKDLSDRAESNRKTGISKIKVKLKFLLIKDFNKKF